MALAPNFVIWAFLLASTITVSGGLIWLAYHREMLWLLRRLLIADVVAAWLIYCVAYQTYWLYLGHASLLGGSLSVSILWGAIGLYVLMRVFPPIVRRPDLILVVVLATWGWVIGAGFDYIEQMQHDEQQLASPELVLADTASLLRPLERALVLTGLSPEVRILVGDILQRHREGQPPEPAQTSILRLVGLDPILNRYERDLAKLRTYQWTQIGLLAMVLLLWGFGHMPREER